MCMFCDMGDLFAADDLDVDPELAAAAASERQRLWEQLMEEIAKADEAAVQADRAAGPDITE